MLYGHVIHVVSLYCTGVSEDMYIYAIEKGAALNWRFVTLKYLRYICNTIAICCQDHVISRFHYGLACNNARYTHIITRLDRDETYPC